MKILLVELVHDAEAVARFYREIKLASQLKPHPHLVQVYDAGPLGASHFLAMEYVEGIDLNRMVEKSGQLPVIRACDYVRQAALGLQHAHEHGLVHRDIKPANLMLAQAPGARSAGLVKVLDLGLARLHGTSGSGGNSLAATLTAAGAVMMGTVDYMAPEQALDFHRADIRADIYSLGCVFHYLLTGKPPFGSGPLAIKLMRHQQAEPPDLHGLRPEVPAELARIVQKMLAKRPSDRYQTPGEVAAALATLQRPVPAGRAGRFCWKATGKVAGVTSITLRLAGRQAWRRPRVALGAGAGILMLATILWLLPSSDQRSTTSNTPPGPVPSLFEQLARQSPLDLLDPARSKLCPPSNGRARPSP